MYDDIKKFHDKFDLMPEGKLPIELDSKAFHFRVDFMKEELYELVSAWEDGNMEEQADALIDLVYVAMGTACLMGLPFEALWDEVHRANMSKQRAERVEDSKRGSKLDVIKPPGWTPPDIAKVLRENDFTQGKMFAGPQKDDIKQKGGE